MPKKIILAICGKSASGKDSLVECLFRSLKRKQVDVNILVPETTRPQRVGETEGIHYHFITESIFNDKFYQDKYLVCSRFRNWSYGIPKPPSLAQMHDISIMIVSPKELKQLQIYKYQFYILPIYLSEKPSVRLMRSRSRENKIKIEHFRRLLSDAYQFRNIKNILESFDGKYLYFKNIGNRLQETRQIIYFLERRQLLKAGQNHIISNFII